MTSKLKCPVCGKTELIRFFNPLTGEYFEDYDCPFRLCNFRGNKVAIDALIQAKQDLEIARDAITDVFGYVKEHEKDIGGCAVNIVIKLGLALTQITHDNSEKANSVEHKE